MTRRHLPALCGLALVAGLLIPASAQAGPYYVRACHSDGINAAFTPSHTTGAVAFVQCPADVNGNAGLVVRNVDSTAPAAGFSHARLAVNTPAGTYVDNISFSGRFYNNSYWQSGLYDRQNGRWLWCGPGCGTLSIWMPFNIGGFATTSLEMLTICGASQCRRDGIQGGLMLKDVTLRIQDAWLPGVSIVGGSIVGDGWHRGAQTVDVVGDDNAGVRALRVFVDGHPHDVSSSSCDDHQLVPCPSPRHGSLSVFTTRMSDGPHTLVAEVQDAGGHVARASRGILVDNTPPDPPQSLSGSEHWRATNAFDVTWSNPSQRGAAPIAGAGYQVCAHAPRTDSCQPAQQVNKADMMALTNVKAPAPGSWRLRLWLIDAAGNQNPQTFRDVSLHWDPDAPTIKLLPRRDDDPTRIRVQAADATSGIASAEVELRRGNDPTWHSLPVTATDDGFSAAIDDETLPAGSYAIRARVKDHAGNEKSAEGEPIRLPVRVTSELAVGRSKRIGANRAGGRRSRRVLIRKPRTRYGRTMKLTGRLTTPGGNPLADRDVEVSQRLRDSGQDWQPVATVRTNASGRFVFKALPGSSRLVRFRYPGTATIRGETSIVDLRVKATSSMRVSRHQVVNGEVVQFKGNVRGEPLPAIGKLLQLQVFSRGGWLTFATPRTDQRGNWRHEYRFTATRGVTRYRFRVRIPREAGYPYEAGTSKPVNVTVTGQ